MTPLQSQGKLSLALVNGQTSEVVMGLTMPETGLEVFQAYQRVLGKGPYLGPGHHVMGYFRNYRPQRGEILSFVAAYLYLRRGDCARAAQRFRALTRSSSQVISTTYQLVLLPVWVALLQSKDGRSLALVNGQTGKTVMGLTLPDEEIDSHE